jgi:hypothetical protein
MSLPSFNRLDRGSMRGVRPGLERHQLFDTDLPERVPERRQMHVSRHLQVSVWMGWRRVRHACVHATLR